MKKNRERKSNISKKVFVAGMVIAVSFSTLTGCSTVAKNANNSAGVAYTSESQVVNALNTTVASKINDKKVLSSTAELVDNGYEVTIITDDTVTQYTLDSTLNVTGSADVSGSTSASTSTETSGTTSATPIQGNVNTDAIKAILATIGEGVVDDADMTVIESIIADITPENVPTVISNLQVAYAQALTFANVKAEDVLDLDFSKEYYMGQNAVVVELKTANAKYTYVFNAETFAVYESKIKLVTTANDETEETSYIAESVATETALKTVDATQETVSNFKIKIGKYKGNKNYKVRFEFDGYDYEINLNAVTGQVVKFKKSITEETVLASTVETAITADDALNIAIAFTGIDLTDTTLTYSKKVKLDYEDGGFVYEVKIKCNNVDYEFEIDATTGEIFDVDVDDDRDDETIIGNDVDDCYNKRYENAHNGKNDDDDDDDGDDDEFKFGNGYFKPQFNFITEETAVQTVLANVNDESAFVVGFDVEFEKGGFFFEIDIETSTLEIEYKVDAISGEATKIKEEVKQTAPNPSNPEKDWWDKLTGENGPVDRRISRQQALEIALKTASTTKQEAKISKIELQQTDNGEVYRVKFSVNSIEYNFEVNALTGQIVESGTMFD